jgi:hypothetical protein
MATTQESPSLNDRVGLPLIDPDAQLTVEEATRLANSDNWADRYAVARVYCCPPELLTMLAEDDNYWVRSLVVRNKNCPEHARVNRLRYDVVANVREHAAHWCRTPTALADMGNTEEDRQVLEAIMGNTATPPEVLTDMLLNYADADVQIAAAGNTSTPLSTLMDVFYAGTVHSEVLTAVATALTRREDVPENVRTVCALSLLD